MTDENTTLIALTVTATAREGGQSVTVSEPVTGNDLRRYKITDPDAKPTVDYDTACVTSDGWADLPANGEIKKITSIRTWRNRDHEEEKA